MRAPPDGRRRGAGPGGDTADLLTGWGGLVGYEDASVFTSAALTGRFVATGDGDDRVWHQIEGRVGAVAGGARPWVSARVPIQGGFVDALDWVVGLGVGIPRSAERGVRRAVVAHRAAARHPVRDAGGSRRGAPSGSPLA